MRFIRAVFILSLLICAESQALIGGNIPKTGVVPSAVYSPSNFCSGTVLVPGSVILTAAHCVQREKGGEALVKPGQNFKVTAYAGSIYNQGRQAFEVKVVDTLVHPSWMKALEQSSSPDDAADLKGTHDLALIFVDQKLPLTPAVLMDLNPVKTNEPSWVLVSGSGANNHESSPTGALKIGVLPIKTSEANKFILDTHEIISGSEMGVAGGDSGGGGYLFNSSGFVEDEKGHHILISVTSTMTKSPVTLDEAVPPVVARVDIPEVISWINTAIAKQNVPSQIAVDLNPADFFENLDQVRMDGVKHKVPERALALKLDGIIRSRGRENVLAKIGEEHSFDFAQFLAKSENVEKKSKELFDLYLTK